MKKIFLPCIKPCAALFAIILTGFWLSQFIQPGPYSSAGPWYKKLLVWDAGWYISIAKHGYGWIPNLHKNGLLEQQNIAFFPLYPLLERGLHGLGFHYASPVMVLPSVAAGIFSVFLFYRLASKLQSKRSAKEPLRSLIGSGLF